MFKKGKVQTIAALLAVLVRAGVISPLEASEYCMKYMSGDMDINSMINDIYEHEFNDNDALAERITDSLMRVEKETEEKQYAV